MKLDLNIKEWIALYGLLERQDLQNRSDIKPIPDKHLLEVHNRMRATLGLILQAAERDQLERWFEVTATKIQHLKEQNQTIKSTVNQVDVLVDDETPDVREYPKRTSGGQNNGRRNKSRR